MFDFTRGRALSPEHCQLGGHRPLVSLDTQCHQDDAR